MKTIGLFFAFIVILFFISTVSARPTKSHSLSRQKRQSDQRIAELETLLALQKYGRHRFRMDRKKEVGAAGEHPPRYGIIDFRMLGRKKKSTRFSPGEIASSLHEVTLQNRPNCYQYEEMGRDHPNRRIDSVNGSSEEGNVYPDQAPISDRDSSSLRADPLFYIEKK